MEIEGLRPGHILKTVSLSLLIFAIGFSLFISIKEREFNLMGLIVSLYYFIPAILFALTYTALIGWLIDKFKFDYLTSSLVVQITISLTLGLLFMTLWTLYDGGPRDYRGMTFSSYWIVELKAYWLPIVYFGITIPVLLRILGRTKK